MQSVVLSPSPPEASAPRSGKPAVASAVTPSAPAAAKRPEIAVRAPSPEQLKEAIEAANQALRARSSSLEFMQDSSTGKVIVRIVDTSTKQVIRQFPSEVMLAIAHAFDRLEGLLVNDEA